MNSDKQLDTQPQTVLIPSLNEYQVSIMRQLVEFNEPRAFPIKVPDGVTSEEGRRKVATALRDLEELKALDLLSYLGEYPGNLQLLAPTTKGYLLFNDGNWSTSIQ